MAKITYTDKVTLNEQPSISAENKVTDDDMNEIKNVVNTNDDNVGDLSNLKTTTKTSIVEAINEIVGEILWTNPHPNDGFSEQDITLNSDDYDIIGWVIRLGITNNNTDILFTIKGWGGRYYYGTQQRQFNRTSNTKYHVTGGTSAVSEAVPIYAIGFKFGLNL